MVSHLITIRWWEAFWIVDAPADSGEGNLPHSTFPWHSISENVQRINILVQLKCSQAGLITYGAIVAASRVLSVRNILTWLCCRSRRHLPKHVKSGHTSTSIRKFMPKTEHGKKTDVWDMEKFALTGTGHIAEVVRDQARLWKADVYA